MTSVSERQNAQVAIENLYQALPAVRPYLFSVADQLVDAAPTASWDVMLCDDMGGRLPTYFMRRVLAQTGHVIPTFFVAGSKKYHNTFGNEAYENYFTSIAGRLGKSSLKVLLTTEATSSGRSVGFLTKRLERTSAQVEIATVANRYPDLISTTYTGGEGKDAAYAVFFAFEATPISDSRGRAWQQLQTCLPKTIMRYAPQGIRNIGKQTVNPLLGLTSPRNPDIPIVSCYAAGNAKLAYSAMEGLVSEYWTGRPAVMETAA